jgi:hypothetical protein
LFKQYICYGLFECAARGMHNMHTGLCVLITIHFQSRNLIQIKYKLNSKC